MQSATKYTNLASIALRRNLYTQCEPADDLRNQNLALAAIELNVRADAIPSRAATT
jgi:hypothetical protein